MNTAPLFTMLGKMTMLSASFQEALQQQLKEERYKPRQILHAAGQLENRLYYLKSGFARSYYFDLYGNEHTVRFYETGDLLFSYEGYYKVPSYFYTEIVEPTEMITISYKGLRNLASAFSETGEIMKQALLKFQKEEYEKQSLVAMSAEERYQILLKKKPGFFQKLPNRIVASYLQMSRETLTKIIGKR